MENGFATARLVRVPHLRPMSPLARLRLTTGLLCAAFVGVGVAINSVRYLQVHRSFFSATGFFQAQVGVLGLLAIVLTVVTMVFGLSYGRGLAARAGVEPGHARAVHMTLALSTVTTIGLHVLAVAAGSSFMLSAARLLVPFVWPDPGGFPYPLAAGIVGLWLIIAFGLSYFVRARLGGHRRWRALHHVVLIAVALGLLHTVLLEGWIPGWGLG